jgi:hypothetical protein
VVVEAGIRPYAYIQLQHGRINSASACFYSQCAAAAEAATQKNSPLCSFIHRPPSGERRGGGIYAAGDQRFSVTIKFVIIFRPTYSCNVATAATEECLSECVFVEGNIARFHTVANKGLEAVFPGPYYARLLQLSPVSTGASAAIFEWRV